MHHTDVRGSDVAIQWSVEDKMKLCFRKWKCAIGIFVFLFYMMSPILTARLCTSNLIQKTCFVVQFPAYYMICNIPVFERHLSQIAFKTDVERWKFRIQLGSFRNTFDLPFPEFNHDSHSSGVVYPDAKSWNVMKTRREGYRFRIRYM
jgi:hypothetical protein